MFPDALWPNLILFLLGQVAGWCILRSGLVATGIAVLGTLWVAGDLALLLRFILEDEGAGYQACLWVTQLTALGSAGWYFTVRWRATRVEARDAARDEIRSIEVLLLRDDRDAAAVRLRRLAKRDPWHLAARILLAREHRRRGQAGRARRLLVGASRIDAGGYADLIRSELAESGATDGEKKADLAPGMVRGRPARAHRRVTSPRPDERPSQFRRAERIRALLPRLRPA